MILKCTILAIFTNRTERAAHHPTNSSYASNNTFLGSIQHLLRRRRTPHNALYASYNGGIFVASLHALRHVLTRHALARRLWNN
jgi:hypothetical protein